nr:hypothetical protein [Armatimonas sp.]
MADSERIEVWYTQEWIRLLDILLGWPEERTQQWIEEKAWFENPWTFHDPPQHSIIGLLLRELLPEENWGELPFELNHFAHNLSVQSWSPDEIRTYINGILMPYHFQLPEHRKAIQ